MKQNWEALKTIILTYYKISVKNAHAKKFELRMKLARLKHDEGELIADYLKRASDISRKLPSDEVDVSMATLRGMRDRRKREQVNYDANKDSNYTLEKVEKLIKAAYSEVGERNPFDPDHKEAIQVVLPIGTKQTNDELLRQAMLNTNQALPAILQALRSLNTNAATSTAGKSRQGSFGQPLSKKDIVDIICYICHQAGHYASNCPHNKLPNSQQ